MKTFIFTTIFLLSNFISIAQNKMPNYYQVLKEFFTTYNIEDEYSNHPNFAKKKEGWYIQQIDKTNGNKLLSEELFWSISTGKYLNLSKNYQVFENDKSYEIKIQLGIQLEEIIKSLSNNPNENSFLNALKKTKIEANNNNIDFTSNFITTLLKQNRNLKLSYYFADQNNGISLDDNDEVVTKKIKSAIQSEIRSNYSILLKRIQNYGGSVDDIDVDEAKGLFKLTFNGVKNPSRIRKLMQSLANLQFWELYQINELANALVIADKNLQNYLNGIKGDNAALLADTVLAKKNMNPFFNILNPMDVQTDSNGNEFYASAIGNVTLQDTAAFFSYINTDVVRNALPQNIKFLLGNEEKTEIGNLHFFPVYAIKTISGSYKAPLEGNVINGANQDYDGMGNPTIKMKMTNSASKIWESMTAKNVNRPIAIVLDDIVYSAPKVNAAIEDGNSEISGNFTIEEAQDLANILKSGKIQTPLKIISEELIEEPIEKQLNDHSNLNDFESKIAPYLYEYDWYDYDRVRYFGYERAALDMVNDFKNNTELSDFDLDGLARSYDRIGRGFLWENLANDGESDSLYWPLKRTELPSKQKINKAVENFNLSNQYFEALNNQNPNYATKIGNSNLKLFHSYMNAYLTLDYYMDKSLKYTFLNKINLDQRYINQAKNYLNSCDSNAILFSYGDNDTYQLRYVQEKYGYRKDVAVINLTLLGLPAYCNMLKNKSIVKFKIPEPFLSKKISDLSYFEPSENQSIRKSKITLRQTIDDIINLKNTINLGEDNYPAFSSNSVLISTPYAKNKSIPITLKNYLVLNDLVMLDIIDCNIKQKPIYFTSNYDNFFDKYMTPSGIVFKVNINKDTNEVYNIKIVKDLEKFVTQKFIPITSDYSSEKTFVSFDGDYTIAYLYKYIIEYYLSVKDKTNAVKWTNDLKKNIEGFSINQSNSFICLLDLLLQTDNQEMALKLIESYAAWVTNAYKSPNSLYGYYSSYRYNETIENLKNTLNYFELKSDFIEGLIDKIDANKQ